MWLKLLMMKMTNHFTNVWPRFGEVEFRYGKLHVLALCPAGMLINGGIPNCEVPRSMREMVGSPRERRAPQSILGDVHMNIGKKTKMEEPGSS